MNLDMLSTMPPQCWYLIAGAFAGLILMIGLRIFRSGKVQVHAGNVEVDLESKTLAPQEPPKA